MALYLGDLLSHTTSANKYDFCFFHTVSLQVNTTSLAETIHVNLENPLRTE